MKKGLCFLLGLISGIVVCFVVFMIIGLANQNNGGLYGATYFNETSKEVNATSFEVFQVIQENAALVHSKTSPRSSYYDGPLYLMVNNIGHFYYDEEIIGVPEECVVLQTGIYKYEAKSGIIKTVPIIGIYNK